MRIIIKIGTNAVYDPDKERIREYIIQGLAKDIFELSQTGNEVIIVTSGAVGCGKYFVKGSNGGLGLKQAQAAIGQPLLMEKYNKYFSLYNLNVAQFLLTIDDLQDNARLNNILEAYKHLIGKAIPIVNENDTTAIEELSFGDNDLLASELLVKLDFDLLLILTEKGALIKEGKSVLETSSFDVDYYDSIDVQNKGFGGLKSKLDSIKKAHEQGKKCIIAKAGDNILDILSGNAISTRFV